MTIQMQKSWTVSVKAKNASFAQRFIISGANVGNGAYDGKTTTPPVFVSGNNWSIRIQNKPTNQPWVDSDDQITFPLLSGGEVRFDIQSNDAGGDQDFDDLVLNCSTPQSSSDFIVYGHAGCYSGRCLFNPCLGPYIVVDTLAAFRKVIENPLLRSAFNELYPEKVREYERIPRPIPIPQPEPDPFIPMVLPLRAQTALPLPMAQEVKRVKGVNEDKETTALVAGRVMNVATQAIKPLAYDRATLAGLVSKLWLHCDTDDLPGFVLRFKEYDRTEAELSGGAYSGEGSREQLGMAVTDRNGNYIFRFTRSGAEFVEEAINDTASGENLFQQMMPDVIAELLDSTAPNGVAYESAPYWNIPSPLKRINICIPCSLVRRPVTQCTGTHRFESVGRIRIGIPANTFDSQGRITATDNSGNVPQARCAAWENTLDLNGCLGDHGTVKYYTLRYRRFQSGTGWSSWEFYQEPFKLFNTAIMDTLPIGPFDRSLEVNNGGPLILVKAYNNVQGDFDWASSEWALRASVNTNSAPFGGHIGPVEFRIQGYDASGQQVADPRNSTIRLYLDNQSPNFVLDAVMLGEQEEGDAACGVFTLAGEPNPAVMSVRFKAVQLQAFMESYQLSLRKGNLPSFPIVTTTGPLGEISAQLSNGYVHGGGVSCNGLIGTRPPDEITAVSDFATAYFTPQIGNWLEPGQTVCAFAVSLSCSKRVTNGYNTAVRSYGTIQKLMAIKLN